VPNGAERSKTPSSSLTTVTAPWGARSSTCRIREPNSCPPTFFSVPRNSYSSLRLANPAIVRSCGAGARRSASTTFDEHAKHGRRPLTHSPAARIAAPYRAHRREPRRRFRPLRLAVTEPARAGKPTNTCWCRVRAIHFKSPKSVLLGPTGI